MDGRYRDERAAESPRELADVLLHTARLHRFVDPSATARRARDLGREDGGHTRRQAVVVAAALALGETLEQLWEAGWMPLDVWELARRRTDEVGVSLLVDGIAADTEQRSPAAVHERWSEQVRRLEAGRWWDHSRPHLSQWAQRHGLDLDQALVAVIELLAALVWTPRLPQILPPPGTASRESRASSGGVDQKILSRVRGLLAKAESTQFPEEAEALSAKAQELMNRHAFERALLDSDVGTRQVAGSARFWLDNPYLEAKSHLVSAIARANRCRSVFYPAVGLVALVGEEMDLQITELLATSLLVQATRAMVAEGSHTTRGGTSRTRSFRRSFLFAYAARIGERLKEAGASAHDPASDPRLLPVLAARSKAVEEAYETLFADAKQKRISVNNGAGWHAGRAAADRADLKLERRTLSA